MIKLIQAIFRLRFSSKPSTAAVVYNTAIHNTIKVHQSTLQQRITRRITRQIALGTTAIVTSALVFALFLCAGFAPYQVLAQERSAGSTSAAQAYMGQIPTLQTLETQALRNHLGLHISRLEVTARQKDVVTAGLSPNPLATLIGDVFNPDQQGQQFGGTLAVPLELGDKRRFRIELAEQLVATQRYLLADRVRTILLNVRLAYFDVVHGLVALALADSIVASYQTLVNINEIRLQQVQIAPTELVRASLALDQAILQRDEAVLAYQKALIALQTSVATSSSFDIDSLLSPADTLAPLRYDSTGLTLERLQAIALARRPDVRAARNLKPQSEANQRLQEANAVPTVSIQGDYVVQQGFPMYGITALIPLPIFDRNQGEREKAAIQREQSERTRELAELVALNEVKAAFAEYQTRRAALNRFLIGAGSGRNSTSVLLRAASIKHAAERSYKAGSISLLELLDAVRVFYELYRSYMQAILLYNKSIATLDAALALDTLETELDQSSSSQK